MPLRARSSRFLNPLSLRFRRIAGGGSVVAMIVAFCLYGSSPLVAMHPNHPLGIDQERAYQTPGVGIDQVDLFSGAVSVAIPIGPFTLINNSNVWHYEVNEQSGEIRARPNWEGTGGIGWHLGWGEVFHPDHTLNNTGRWLYVGGDGGRHTLYPTLHRLETNQDPRVFYTRDGSYLRMRLSANNCHADIEEPDGTTRRFTGSCGPLTTYRLRKVWSPYASEADPDLTITYGIDPADPNGTDDTLRTVVNRYGLTHKVHLSDRIGGQQVNWVRRIVTKVVLESFGGQEAVYDFHYQQVPVDVSCKDDSGTTPARISTPHLDRIDLPDGTSYSMEEGGQLLYQNRCEPVDGFLVDDLPGVLNGINLPTGGKIRWAFQRYEFPPGDTSSVFNTSAGIKTRTLYEADGTELGTWTYKTQSVPPMPTEIPEEPTHPEMHLEVVYPTGDCSKHFFNAIYWVDPVNSSGQPWGWERGLPFVYSEESGGKYLSSRIYSADDGHGSCLPKSILRSTYLRFRHDETPGTDEEPLQEWYDTNRQVEASRVVYHDDGDKYVDTEWTEFDGLGHFRRTVTTGNLWQTANSERRETFVGYDRSTGTYPGDYVPVPTTEPWILDVFDATEVSEPDAFGEIVGRTEYDFERDTGFLSSVRVLATGTLRGADDLVTVRTRDSLGRVVDVKQYRGETAPPEAPNAGRGTVPSEPDYWVRHEYDALSGARIRTQPLTPTGVKGPFPTHDVDVEAKTGFVTRSRDTAGFFVDFDYDTAGRLTAVTPQTGARIVFTYTNPTSAAAAKVTTTFENASGAVLAERQVVSDGFGRPRLLRRKLPGNVWAERQTTRNARGWVTAVSEWGDLTKATSVVAFDPFGRPARIRPPDGSGHDMIYVYKGDRKQWTRTKRALAAGEAYTTRRTVSDSYGRLRELSEDSEEGEAAAVTHYKYDVGDRLTEIVSGQQVRAFTYDNRGFLLSERHPEKGATGNGTVTYSDYDAGGLPHRMIDGPHDLRFFYDFMGRPTDTQDVNNDKELVTRLTWDGAAGLGKGKLHTASRFNTVDLAWNPQGPERVEIQQVFAYDGVGGAVSAKETAVLWSVDDVRFRQEYAYDDLGNRSSIVYPSCDLPASCTASSVATGPTVASSYDQGLLTTLPGWVDDIVYHQSGLWSEIHHANGVTEHQAKGDSFSQRPKQLYTTGVSPGYDSGTMLYDGAGDIKAMGTDTFTYDRVGRLVEASYQNASFNQTYAYDRFGNLTDVGGFSFGMESPPVDPATNRLIGVPYDGAGNVLSLDSPIATEFTYDSSNRLTSQAHMRYLYDAFGERAMSIDNLPHEAAIFHLRDLDHRLLGKIRMNDGVWSRDRDYIYAGDRLVARASSGGGAERHFHLDHLGSVRLVTGIPAAGPVSVLDSHPFLPYGGEAAPGPPAAEDSLLFTGHERDFSTGSDYMHARHYLWNLGRFLSTDPAPGNPAAPQSLNRYAYVMGNPLNFTDPTGRQGEPVHRFGDEIHVTAEDKFRSQAIFLSVAFTPVSAFANIPVDSLSTILTLAAFPPNEIVDVLEALPTNEIGQAVTIIGGTVAPVIAGLKAARDAGDKLTAFERARAAFWRARFDGRHVDELSRLARFDGAGRPSVHQFLNARASRLQAKALQAQAKALQASRPVMKLSTRLFALSGVGTIATLASGGIDLWQYQLDNAIAAQVHTSGAAAVYNARVQSLKAQHAQATARAFNAFRGIP